MKKLLSIIGLFVFGVTYAQEKNKIDTTTFKVGKNTVIFINTVSDSIKYNYDFNQNDSNSCFFPKKKNDWPKISLDLGTNGYLSKENDFNLPENQQLYRLNYNRSRSFGTSIYFKAFESQDKLFYVSPGVGFTWNSYHFDQNININNVNNKTQVELNTNVDYQKYKLRATYLEIPLIVGTTLGSGKNHFVFQVGGIAGLKIGSVVKQKFQQDGLEHQVKIKDDFNLNPFKLDCIMRISVGNLGLFARYSFTNLFENDKAPNLHPFAVGLSLHSF